MNGRHNESGKFRNSWTGGKRTHAFCAKGKRPQKKRGISSIQQVLDRSRGKERGQTVGKLGGGKRETKGGDLPTSTTKKKGPDDRRPTREGREEISRNRIAPRANRKGTAFSFTISVKEITKFPRVVAHAQGKRAGKNQLPGGEPCECGRKRGLFSCRKKEGGRLAQLRERAKKGWGGKNSCPNSGEKEHVLSRLGGGGERHNYAPSLKGKKFCPAIGFRRKVGGSSKKRRGKEPLLLDAGKG